MKKRSMVEATVFRLLMTQEGMTEEKASKILKGYVIVYDLIDAFPECHGYMHTFFFAFCWKFHDITGLDLSNLGAIWNTLVRGFDTKSIVFDEFKEILTSHMDANTLNRCIFYAMFKVNEEWVRNHGYEQRKTPYRLLPLDLYGKRRVKEVMAFFIYGQEFLKMLGYDLKPNSRSLTNYYSDIVESHITEENLRSGYFAEYVFNYLYTLGVDYPGKEELLQMVRDPKVIEEIYNQVNGGSK